MLRAIILGLFMLLSGTLLAQFKSETAIRQVLQRQTKAWNNGDLETYMQGYWKNDSLMFIGKNGVTYGWANTLKNYKKGYPDKTAMGQLSFNIIKVVRLSSKTYNVVGQWKLIRSAGNLQGHYTLLFKKIKGQWVITQDHSS